MKGFINKGKNKLIWWFSELKWFFLLPFCSNKGIEDYHKFSIGITTFKDRFTPFFKPLIKKLNYLFPNNQIIVMVNGHVKHQEQIVYLKKIKRFLSKYSNVTPLYYETPVGLSKMWNQIILNSPNDKILILNDDLNLQPSFTKELFESKILASNVGVINGTWGNFVIDKEIIKEVGWFDERLTEIGGEDDDYAARLAISNIEIKKTDIKSIKNAGKKYRFNSYGHNMKSEHSYSIKNTEFLNSKWDYTNEPRENYTYVPDRKYIYWRIKEGMETPDFYMSQRDK